jgi:hypothetical protein
MKTGDSDSVTWLPGNAAPAVFRAPESGGIFRAQVGEPSGPSVAQAIRTERSPLVNV